MNLLLIIVVILLLGGGGGWYGYNNGWGGPLGPGPVGGIVPIILIVLLIWMLMGRG